MSRAALLLLIKAGLIAGSASAQQPPTVPAWVQSNTPVFAIVGVQLVDGTGREASKGMTIVVRDGRIAAVGLSKRTAIPAGALVINGRGKTILPGFVMMHEHMFYPTGFKWTGYAHFTSMLHSFPPLHLAGGVTTLRTAGSLNTAADLNLKDAIAAGKLVGPDMDVTAPYVNGPGVPVLEIRGSTDPDHAERLIDYWAGEGATSIKLYVNASREIAKRAIEAAHRRGLKVTGHLCAVTYREAADIGIDNLEHGFFAATDFVAGKSLDTCPDDEDNLKSLDPEGADASALIAHLVARKVALTSTLPVFEAVTPGRPKLGDNALSVLLPQVRVNYETFWALSQKRGNEQKERFRKAARLERRFAQAGGLLLAGTDPTGIGGVIPGFASKRQIQLMVEAGFPFEEAVKVATLNGARFLGRDKEIGSVEVGKRADLILIAGDPVRNPNAIEDMPTVFKSGVAYDAKAIIASMKATVGLH